MGSNYTVNHNQFTGAIQARLTGFKTLVDGRIEKRMIVMQEVRKSCAFL